MAPVPSIDAPHTAGSGTAVAAWTCPFCALLCETRDAAPAVPYDCPRARAGLSALSGDGQDAAALDAAIDGRPVDAATALHEAARRLAVWRQPLFGGLGTDVAGARALYRLAARTGAWCDAADGDALMTSVRAVQDRGQMTTTFAELHSRADLVVMVGTDAAACPAFPVRAGFGEPDSPCRRLVFLGIDPPAWAAATQAGPTPPALQPLPGGGDLAADLQQLAALLDGRRLPRSDPALADLAQRLQAARYAVLVWEPAALPADHGALVAELLNRLVVRLNRGTRAASFALGGHDGAASVNQTFTWLSGLPLRTRVSADDGLLHAPLLGAARRLIDGGAVDGLLWIASFDPARLPPTTALPEIVLAPPAMAPRLAARPAPAGRVFIPVATPGVHAAGHLFRTDGPVVLPLRPRADVPAGTLRGVAEVLDAIGLGLKAPPPGGTAAA